MGSSGLHPADGRDGALHASDSAYTLLYQEEDVHVRHVTTTLHHCRPVQKTIPADDTFLGSFISENPLVAQIQYWMKICFVFILILFIDSVNRVYRVQVELAAASEANGKGRYVVHELQRSVRRILQRKWPADIKPYSAPLSWVTSALKFKPASSTANATCTFAASPYSYRLSSTEPML